MVAAAGAGEDTRSAHQLLFQIADDLPDARIDGHAVFHQTAGVEHGAVVASAKGFTNGVEGAFGHLPREEHGDLTREGDVFRAALAGQDRKSTRLNSSHG